MNDLPDAEAAWDAMCDPSTRHKPSWTDGFHAGVEAAAARMLAELDIELPVADPAGVASEVAA